MLAFELLGQDFPTLRRPPGDSTIRFETLDSRLLLSGTLDSTFGAGGMLSSDFGSDDFGYGVAVQSDGRIVVAGTVRTSSGGNDFGLVRYMPDGSVDTSFGINGFVTLDFGTTSASNDEVRAIAIDSSGRILVAGWANRGVNNDFAVARLNGDGSLDSSFGVGGRAVNNFVSNDQAFAMAIQSDGKILVAGLVSNDFGIARYNTDGSLDAGFGSGGFVRTSFGTGLDAATSIAIQSDGRFVVGGYSMFSTNSDFAVARYNANGTLDLTLDGDGMVLTNVGASSDQANAVAVMSDGRIVLAGRSNGNVAVVRYNTNGARDQSFGTSGIARIDLGGANDSANAMLLLSDGKILLAGAAGALSAARDFALLQLNLDGSLDASFGTAGVITSDFASDRDEAFAMAMQADGRIVLAGCTTPNSASPLSYNFGAARYTMQDQPVNQPPTANAGGPYSVSEGSSVQLFGDGSSDPDGSIVSFEWDFDYDGSNFDTDATGSSATFDASNLDGPTSRVVALRVTDDSGATHIATATVDVSNVDPSANLSGNTSGVAGQTLSFTANFSDPGVSDTHHLVWDFGDGTIIEMDASGGSASAEHAYTATGDYTVTVTVFDDDGGSSSSSMQVAIGAWALQPDPNDPSKVSLVVSGSDGKDVIMFKYQRGQVWFCMNGQKIGGFDVTDRIIAFGNGGNDRIMVSGNYRGPVEFHGGAGNDHLKGAQGDDMLDGGDGNDLLVGHRGDDLLLGGAGNDILLGGHGNDTLDGGEGRDLMRAGQGNNEVVYDPQDHPPRKLQRRR